MKTTEGLKGSYRRCFFYFHIFNVLSKSYCLIREIWNYKGKKLIIMRCSQSQFLLARVKKYENKKSTPALSDAFQRALQRKEERLRLNIPDSYAFPFTSLA